MVKKDVTATEIKDYHESRGEKVPPVGDGFDDDGEPKGEAKIETTGVAAQVEAPEIPVFTDKKPEEEPPKKGAKPDPHAENHAKALREARDEHRKYKTQMEGELRARDERHAALERKFNEVFAEKQPAAPTIDQPIDYFEHKSKKQEAELAELKTWKQQQEQSQQQHAQFRDFWGRVGAAAKPFIDATPDYKDAYDHVITIKRQELQLAGVPEAQIGNQMGLWELNFAGQAIQSERSPSEAIYQYAKTTGFKGKPQGSDAQRKLEAIQRGQEASKTLDGGGGGHTELSLEALEAMTDEQIRELAKDPKKWLKIAKSR